MFQNSDEQEKQNMTGQQVNTISLTQIHVKKEDQYSTSYNKLFPMKFGKTITLHKISWDHFKGKVDDTMPWSAHIYWNILYKITNDSNPRLCVSVVVSPKSWVRPQKKSSDLLNHQHGHLIIGYLCALQFIKHIQQSKIQPLYIQYVNGVFRRILKQYQKLEHKYDQETNHRLNFEKQAQWDCLLRKKISHFKKSFNDKKNKFIKQPHQI